MISLVTISEKRDPYTAGHQNRVAKLACAIAKEMGLSQSKINGILIAGKLHDIGKIYVPTDILNKPGRLSDIEFALIKIHSTVGYDILKHIPFESPVADIIVQHHERINGTGYPKGLKQEDILLEAKILGVADVVEAMVSHRPYRPSLGIEKALTEIKTYRGTYFDSQVVDACLKVFDKGYSLEQDENPREII